MRLKIKSIMLPNKLNYSSKSDSKHNHMSNTTFFPQRVNDPLPPTILIHLTLVLHTEIESVRDKCKEQCFQTSKVVLVIYHQTLLKPNQNLKSSNFQKQQKNNK